MTATTVTMQASQEGCRARRARRARHGDGTVEDDTTRPVAQCQGRVLCHGPCHGPCHPCCVGGNNVTQSQHNSQHRGVNTSNQPRDVDTTWQFETKLLQQSCHNSTCLESISIQSRVFLHISFGLPATRWQHNPNSSTDSDCRSLPCGR